jgi:hypothetical protein
MASMNPRNSPNSPFSGIADSPKFPETPFRGSGVFGRWFGVRRTKEGLAKVWTIKVLDRSHLFTCRTAR